MRNRRLKFIPVFICVFLFFACASYRESLETSERVVLGLLLESTDGTPWGMAGTALIERARTAGFEVQVRSAAGKDGEARRRLAREMIGSGANLLVATSSPGEVSPAPPGSDRSLPVPIIACGGLIPGLRPAVYVGPDAEEAGSLQFRTARERMTDGGMVLLGGPEGDFNASRLREGQLGARAEWGENREEPTDIIADLRLDPPTTAEGRLHLAELLRDPAGQGGGVSAVLAFNDEVAAGAAAVLAENALAGKVAVAGRGASLAACRRIIEGGQLLTLYTPPEDLATAAIRAAIRLARGMDPGEVAESMDLEPRQLDSGGGPVPAVLLPPVLITRATMVETVILDGLHPIEAVYGSAGEKPSADDAD